MDWFELEPHKPERDVDDFASDWPSLLTMPDWLVWVLRIEEFPKASKRPDPRKVPEWDPTDGVRTIKAVRDCLSLMKSRHCRYRRFLGATSARFRPKQYLFFPVVVTLLRPNVAQLGLFVLFPGRVE